MPVGIDGNGIITGVSDFSSSNVSLTDPEITGGIYLGGTGSANYLDDYEEGTWTPADKSDGGLTFSVSFSKYTKIGQLVTAQLFLSYPSNSDSDDARIEGLPFTAPSFSSAVVETNSSAQVRSIQVVNGGDDFTIRSVEGNSITNAQLSDSYFIISVSYITDS